MCKDAKPGHSKHAKRVMLCDSAWRTCSNFTWGVLISTGLGVAQPQCVIWSEDLIVSIWGGYANLCVPHAWRPMVTWPGLTDTPTVTNATTAKPNCHTLRDHSSRCSKTRRPEHQEHAKNIWVYRRSHGATPRALHCQLYSIDCTPYI
jgi:hypothetical protein